MNAQEIMKKKIKNEIVVDVFNSEPFSSACSSYWNIKYANKYVAFDRTRWTWNRVATWLCAILFAILETITNLSHFMHILYA